MEDQQNPKNTEQNARRRRAVRSVPMGNPNDVRKPVPTQQQPGSVRSGEQVLTEQPASGVPAAEKPILETPIPPTAEPPKPEPAVVHTPPERTVSTEHTAPYADDAFSVEQTFAPQPKQVSARPSIPLGAVLVTAAVIVVLCVLAILPFLRTTEAVMLYVDDTAIGYIENQEAAEEQASRLQGQLTQTALASGQDILYRCETTDVRGTVSLLSEDAIYDAMFAHAADGYVRAYRLVLSDAEAVSALSASDRIGIGDPIAVMTEAEILSAIDAAKDILTAQYAPNLPPHAVLSVTPRFSWEPTWSAEEAILDEGALTALLTDDGHGAAALLSVTAAVTETEAERIPYETTLVPNDENYDGIRSMISPGADGLARVSYTVMLDPVTGAVLSRHEQSRVVVREPVHAVSYEGLYPLPDGVSTGTFDWPLPELPDDELPLDENGNPYMPENPLALKNTYVSSGYGERDLWGTYDFHLGLDIVAPAYTEIYAADGGVVIFAAFTSSYGYMTRILHEDNVETVYAHQIKQVVKPGDVVKKGQLIGYVGSTGNSSGSHLHLEFRRDHVTVDPLEYIEIPEEITVLGEGY